MRDEEKYTSPRKRYLRNNIENGFTTFSRRAVQRERQTGWRREEGGIKMRGRRLTGKTVNIFLSSDGETVKPIDRSLGVSQKGRRRAEIGINEPRARSSRDSERGYYVLRIWACQLQSYPSG